MPTFLESLWLNLYSQDCARRFAAYSSCVPPLEIADLTAEQKQEIGTLAAAFADAMVQATPGATLALLQAQIVALKP